MSEAKKVEEMQAKMKKATAAAGSAASELDKLLKALDKATKDAATAKKELAGESDE